jgi:hypothetical protein
VQISPGEEGDNMSQSNMYKRRKFTSTDMRARETIDDFADYDDERPTRTRSSALHYPSLADVKTEVGRSRPDVQSFSPQRNQRSIEAELERPIPPRRSATQTNMPAVQVRKGRVVHTGEVGLRETEVAAPV